MPRSMRSLARSGGVACVMAGRTKNERRCVPADRHSTVSLSPSRACRCACLGSQRERQRAALGPAEEKLRPAADHDADADRKANACPSGGAPASTHSPAAATRASRLHSAPTPARCRAPRAPSAAENPSALASDSRQRPQTRGRRPGRRAESARRTAGTRSVRAARACARAASAVPYIDGGPITTAVAHDVEHDQRAVQPREYVARLGIVRQEPPRRVAWRAATRDRGRRRNSTLDELERNEPRTRRSIGTRRARGRACRTRSASRPSAMPRWRGSVAISRVRRTRRQRDRHRGARCSARTCGTRTGRSCAGCAPAARS